jgi:hypothetical protein
LKAPKIPRVGPRSQVLTELELIECLTDGELGGQASSKWVRSRLRRNGFEASLQYQRLKKANILLNTKKRVFDCEQVRAKIPSKCVWTELKAILIFPHWTDWANCKFSYYWLQCCEVFTTEMLPPHRLNRRKVDDTCLSGVLASLNMIPIRCANSAVCSPFDLSTLPQQITRH